MSTIATNSERVVSGMRSTGPLHLGHYHGVLKNWLQLQHEFECFFFVADWHALTTHYEQTQDIKNHVWEVLIDWLSVGINPNKSHIFIQSWVPEHAELFLLLSMTTPLGWLERVPSYKEQQEKLHDKDLSTYGFLGYPLLQAADVLIYKGDYVPVGEDQVPHIELTREIARRFNYLYGREANFVELAEAAIAKMGKKQANLYRNLRKAYQERGDHEALEQGQALLKSQANISLGDQERLYGYLEGGAKLILPETKALLTPTSKFPGLDGQKMSKSYHNTISLREASDSLESKIKTMPTDPARVRRTDPGEPEKCPVWGLHQIYADDSLKQWVQTGCRTAGIGCLECKRPLIDAMEKEIKPIRAAAKEFNDNPSFVRNIITEGAEQARDEAKKTLQEVREAMGLDE